MMLTFKFAAVLVLAMSVVERSSAARAGPELGNHKHSGHKTQLQENQAAEQLQMVEDLWCAVERATGTILDALSLSLQKLEQPDKSTLDDSPLYNLRGRRLQQPDLDMSVYGAHDNSPLYNLRGRRLQQPDLDMSVYGAHDNSPLYNLRGRRLQQPDLDMSVYGAHDNSPLYNFRGRRRMRAA